MGCEGGGSQENGSSCPWGGVGSEPSVWGDTCVREHEWSVPTVGQMLLWQPYLHLLSHSHCSTRVLVTISSWWSVPVLVAFRVLTTACAAVPQDSFQASPRTPDFTWYWQPSPGQVRSDTRGEPAWVR